MNWFLIALGGALGAMTRFGIGNLSERWFSDAFPFGTLIANLSGCFLIGVLIGGSLRHPNHWTRAHIGVGFLGSLTTFSTFSAETIGLIEQQRWGVAGLNVCISLTAGLLAVVAGLYVGRKLFAVGA